MTASLQQSEAVGQVRLFDPHRVRPLPDQPRKRFRRIRELADSIGEVGQRMPGEVTLIDHPVYDAQLVDGERRLRACRLLLCKFRAVVSADADPETVFANSFAANFGKDDHDVLETAESIHRLHTQGGKSVYQIAKLAGKSQSWVTSHLAILKLCPAVQQMLIAQVGEEKPKLTFNVGFALARLPEAAQIKIAQQAAGGIDTSRLRALIHKAQGRQVSSVKLTGKSMARLSSTVEGFRWSLGRYLDLSGEQINEIIDSAGIAIRRALVAQIESLVGDLQAMAKAVEARAGIRKQI